MKTRRFFLSGLATAAAASFTETLRAAPDPKKDVVIGHGGHRYKVNKEWVPAGQGRHHPILNCHEMVQGRDGRLFMIGDHWDNQMLVFKPDGTILDSWGSVWPGGHGLTLSNENGEEFLFVTDSGLWKSGSGGYRQTGRITKIDLTGKEIFSISHPMSVGAYEPGMVFNPTETAIAPNGDIYVVDGYGSQFVLRYDARGKFIQRFGGKDGVPAEERLNNAHGIAIDTRAGTDKATVIVTSRVDNCFRRFTLDGKYLETLAVPGAMVCRPVIAGQELYAGVCWSKTPEINKLPQNPSGFTVILDAAGKVVSAPGGTAPVYEDGKLQPLMQAERIFDHGHDVCVLDNGDLIVCQWNAFQTYPVKLEKVVA
jgi:DNA-binding beta-propeller fold protein YncE